MSGHKRHRFWKIVKTTFQFQAIFPNQTLLQKDVTESAPLLSCRDVPTVSGREIGTLDADAKIIRVRQVGQHRFLKPTVPYDNSIGVPILWQLTFSLIVKTDGWFAALLISPARTMHQVDTWLGQCAAAGCSFNSDWGDRGHRHHSPWSWGSLALAVFQDWWPPPWTVMWTTRGDTLILTRISWRTVEMTRS